MSVSSFETVCGNSEVPMWPSSSTVLIEDYEVEAQNSTSNSSQILSLTETRRPSPGQALQVSVSSSSLLLRFFNSSIFNVHYAMEYLFRSRELGVQAYLADRLFSFPSREVDFYLPQLAILFLRVPESGKYLSVYLRQRALKSARFSTQLAWILETLTSGSSALTSQNGAPVTDQSNVETTEMERDPPVTSALSRRQSEPKLYMGSLDDVAAYTSRFEDSSISSSMDHVFPNANGDSALPNFHTSKLHSMPQRFAALSRPDIRGVAGHVHWAPLGSVPASISGSDSAISPLTVDSAAPSSFLKHKRAISDLTSFVNSQANKDDMYNCSPDSGQYSFLDISMSPSNLARCRGDFETGLNYSLSLRNSMLLSTRSQSWINMHNKSSANPLTRSETHLQNVAPFSRISMNSPHLSRLTEQLTRFLLPRQLANSCETEWDFIHSLLSISRRLGSFSCKEQRTGHLQAELAKINLGLPARVWLPVDSSEHMVLRIPPSAAVCLNSTDKAPYLIFVEVLACDDISKIRLPPRTGLLSLLTPSNIPKHLRTRVSPTSKASNGFGGAKAIAAPDIVSIFSNESGSSSDGTQSTAKSTPLTIDQNVSETQEISPLTCIKAIDVRRRLEEYSASQPQRPFKLDPKDPSAAVLKEPLEMKARRIQESSPWGHLPGWQLAAVIIKVGDDLRQEQLAYQLLNLLQRLWRENHVDLWLRPLNIIITSADSGLIELVADTVSLHQIRRHARLSLRDYIIREHGLPNSEGFLSAQRNFVQSCAAYCVVGYLFQVKDRHNGNILIDKEGHVIHIDYGFMLSASPGKNFGFETSPFKLTSEQVELMGGVDSDMFRYYKLLILRGLLAARKHMEELCLLVEIARLGYPHLPCFSKAGGTAAVSALRQRFLLTRTEDYMRSFVSSMVEASLHSITTRLYDSYQYYTNGIQ